MTAQRFSLVVPLWNEAANIRQLLAAIEASGLPVQGMAELIAVNNGSEDTTGELLNESISKYSWLTVVELPENLNYGGGVYEGMKHAREPIVCYIPGDLQVMPDDVLKVFEQFKADGRERLFVKGHRTIRHDTLQTRFVSQVYTLLANLVLGLRVRDVNGLPKMFHRSLLDQVPVRRMQSFVFDSQLLSLARRDHWTVREVPVTFHSRREGVSSWSGRRIRVYLEVFGQLLALRRLRAEPGVPLGR